MGSEGRTGGAEDFGARVLAQLPLAVLKAHDHFAARTARSSYYPGERFDCPACGAATRLPRTRVRKTVRL